MKIELCHCFQYPRLFGKTKAVIRQLMIRNLIYLRDISVTKIIFLVKHVLYYSQKHIKLDNSDFERHRLEIIF